MIDLLIAREALRDAFAPRRLITAGILVALPSLIGLIIRAITPDARWEPGDVYDQIAALLIFGFTLTILAVVYGTSVIGQEMEQRTIVYLLTRPVPRWRILLAKSLVACVVVVVISVVTLLCLAITIFGPAHIREAGLWPDIRSLAIGAFAYSSLFVLLGAMVPRPLLFALLFVFGWESLVPHLPGSFARVSVMSYLRVLSAREANSADPADTGDLAAGGDATGGGGSNNPASLIMKFTQPPSLMITDKQAWLILGIVTVVALIAAMVIFSRREYTPREDQE